MPGSGEGASVKSTSAACRTYVRGKGVRAHIRYKKTNQVKSVSYEQLSRQLSGEMAAVREIAVGLTPVRCLLLRSRHSTEWRGSGVASRAALGQ